jgi:NADH-quinone oxidoreductase subunit N
VLGVLTSVVAAFYYLRIIKVMFFDDTVEVLEKDPDVPRTTVVMLSLAFIVALVYAPEPLLIMCRSAAMTLF